MHFGYFILGKISKTSNLVSVKKFACNAIKMHIIFYNNLALSLQKRPRAVA